MKLPTHCISCQGETLAELPLSNGVAVCCPKCGACGPVKQNISLAIEAYNRMSDCREGRLPKKLIHQMLMTTMAGLAICGDPGDVVDVIKDLANRSPSILRTLKATREQHDSMKNLVDKMKDLQDKSKV